MPLLHFYASWLRKSSFCLREIYLENCLYGTHDIEVINIPVANICSESYHDSVAGALDPVVNSTSSNGNQYPAIPEVIPSGMVVYNNHSPAYIHHGAETAAAFDDRTYISEPDPLNVYDGHWYEHPLHPDFQICNCQTEPHVGRSQYGV